MKNKPDGHIHVKSKLPGKVVCRIMLFVRPYMLFLKFMQGRDTFVPGFTHAHSEYEFFFPYTATPNMVLENVQVFGETGLVYPVQPGKIHGLRYGQLGMAHDSLMFSPEFMEKALESCGLKNREFLEPFPMTEELTAQIQAILRECRRWPINEEALRCRVMLIAITLAELGIGKLPPMPQGSRYGKGIRATTLYINQNYTKNITLEELAGMAGYAKSSFITVFKGANGLSPMAYVQKLRINQAKFLLENTGYSISDIARMSGYGKTSSFSTQFKRNCGLTPMEYRRGETDPH